MSSFRIVFEQLSSRLWSVFCPSNVTPKTKVIAEMRFQTQPRYISQSLLSTELQLARLQDAHAGRGKFKQSNFVQPVWRERLFAVYTPSVA